jgi:CRISPR-associated exonuclease Cas4
VPILQSLPFTGTQVNYSLICLTKLWLFSHNVTMESSSDLVAMGQFIHETSYSRERKDVVIGRIGIDFVKKGDRITVHEVKKSKRFEKAHRYQVYYYIYYLQVVLVPCQLSKVG